jgi:hypothetical protein
MSKYLFILDDYFEKTEEQRQFLYSKVLFDLGMKVSLGEERLPDLVKTLSEKELRAASKEQYQEAQFYKDIKDKLEQMYENNR